MPQLMRFASDRRLVAGDTAIGTWGIVCYASSERDKTHCCEMPHNKITIRLDDPRHGRVELRQAVLHRFSDVPRGYNERFGFGFPSRDVLLGQNIRQDDTSFPWILLRDTLLDQPGE